MQRINVSDVVFRKDLYPRIEHDQQKAQEYSENIEQLPPIELNQHNELIDGFHRLTAHKLAKANDIAFFITKTESDEHLLELSIDRNAKHGLQMNQSDKRKMAIRLYAAGKRTSERKQHLAKLLSVSVRALQFWVSDLDQAEREARKEMIIDMYLKCYTLEEIGEAVDLTHQSITKEIQVLLQENESLRKSAKVTFSGQDFMPPIYNVWTYAKKSNNTDHFGNTEKKIPENLVYLFTNPFDIVIDPFGGGGATLDICRERYRRCWISDINPKAGLEDKIRTMDIVKELPPLNKRWSEVALTYLDPPYWRQAQGEYSDSPDDLANMPLDEFTENMVSVVRRIADKQKQGAIALIIQPTQWRSDDRMFTDHVFDICSGVGKQRNLKTWNRIQCPYSTEQCTPQMVNWAKDNKEVLVLSRELIIWKIQ